MHSPNGKKKHFNRGYSKFSHLELQNVDREIRGARDTVIELYERRGNINFKKRDLVNKQIDTDCWQLDSKIVCLDLFISHLDIFLSHLA